MQSDRLIDGTIRDNVLMFRRGLPDSAVYDALRAAAVDDFVLKLPMGLDTMVAEGVTGLSGGQRQRLLLGRALPDDPRLIVLDEATSSLEVEIEASILQQLKRNGATTVLMAHRPEVWRLADRIIHWMDLAQLSQMSWPYGIALKLRSSEETEAERCIAIQAIR